MSVPTPNSSVETVTLNVNVLGHRAFGRESSHEGGAFINGISAHLGRDMKER